MKESTREKWTMDTDEAENSVIDFELHLAMADMNVAVDALRQATLKAKARGVGRDEYDDDIAKATNEFKSVSDRFKRAIKRRGVSRRDD
jgi:hypothetical protein